MDRKTFATKFMIFQSRLTILCNRWRTKGWIKRNTARCLQWLNKAVITMVVRNAEEYKKIKEMQEKLNNDRRGRKRR